MADGGAGRAGAISRRAAVAGLGGALLLAGCTPVPPAPAVVTTTPSSPARPPATWTALRGALRGRLIRPEDLGYAAAARLENPRFDGARPLGIAVVADAQDVALCLAFARRTRTPVAIRSGGHSYAGWSAGGAAGTDVPPSLVISTAGLDAVRLDGDRAVVGPGARLIDVYSALAARGRAVGGGTCPTVAIGGLALGGGIGVLDRAWGLTCDQVVALTIVTADGRVRRVSADADPDLLWAARGGGTGTIGVVTELELETRPAPSVVRFAVPITAEGTAEAVDAWQRSAPQADDRLWTSLHLTVRPGAEPRAGLVGAWIGDGDPDLRALRDAGGSAFGALDAVREDSGTAMRAFAGCSGIAPAACRTGDGGALQRVPESATSSIAASALPEDGVAALLGRIAAGRDVAGMREGGILLDPLGGAIGRVAPDATAFPHRRALYTVQYTATFTAGSDPAPFDRYVTASRAAMTPWFGDAAYANYADPSIPDPGAAYFGGNLARLQRTIAAVDPDGLLAQPHFALPGARGRS